MRWECAALLTPPNPPGPTFALLGRDLRLADWPAHKRAGMEVIQD